MSKEFGRLVARMRASRGLSQSDLARQAGISRDAVAQVEAGNRMWRPTTALNVLSALNRDPRVPVLPTEVREYIRLSGLSESAAVGVLRAPGIEMVGDRPATPAAHHRHAQLHAMLDDLIALVGEEPAYALLLAGLKSANAAREGQAAPSSAAPAPGAVPARQEAEGELIRVELPPEQKDGYVEIRYHIYRRERGAPPRAVPTTDPSRSAATKPVRPAGAAAARRGA